MLSFYLFRTPSKSGTAYGLLPLPKARVVLDYTHPDTSKFDHVQIGPSDFNENRAVSELGDSNQHLISALWSARG